MLQQSWRKSCVAQILLTSFCNKYSSNWTAATESSSCFSEKDLHASNYQPTWLNKTRTCKKIIYRQEGQQNLPVNYSWALLYLFLMFFLMLVSSLNLPKIHTKIGCFQMDLRNSHLAVLQWHNSLKDFSCPNWAEHWFKDSPTTILFKSYHRPWHSFCPRYQAQNCTG